MFYSTGVAGSKVTSFSLSPPPPPPLKSGFIFERLALDGKCTDCFGSEWKGNFRTIHSQILANLPIVSLSSLPQFGNTINLPFSTRYSASLSHGESPGMKEADLSTPWYHKLEAEVSKPGDFSKNLEIDPIM